MTELSKIEDALFKLVNCALWGKGLKDRDFSVFSDTQWQELISLSQRQGLLAIAYDGVKMLSVGALPPKKIIISWAINVELVEKRFARQQKVCSNLVMFYRKHSIEMMLMKGVGLAASYPVPNHREGGDLDIWLKGDYERGNSVIEAEGIAVTRENKKHSTFCFEGIYIENHASFLDINRHNVDIILEKSLLEIVGKEPFQRVYLFDDTYIDTPSPTFNAIFLARHMIMHLLWGLVVRQLCDWAIFLKTNYGKYDRALLIEKTGEAGILPILIMLNNLAIKYVGLEQKYSPFEKYNVEIDAEIEERILLEILRPKEYNYKWSLIRKSIKVIDTQWKNRIANSESLCKRISVKIKSMLAGG